MECTVNAKSFSSYLAHVASVAPKKTTKEVLSMMVVEAKKDSIVIKATNMTVELVATVKDNITVKKPGSVLVNAVKLSSIIKGFRDSDCTLKATTKNLVVKCGKSTFKLALGTLCEYLEIKPDKKVVQSCKLESDGFESLVNNVSFAVDTVNSDVVYSYDTILLQGRGEEFKCVALDGKRLSYGKMKCEGKLTSLFSLFSPKSFTLLKKLSKKQTHITLNDYDSIIVFDIGDYSYSVRTVVGKMPDYEKFLVLKDNYFYFDIDRNEFLRIVKQMLVISSTGYNSVWLSIKPGNLKVYTDVIDNNEAKVDIPIETNANRDFLIKLNGSSLYDIVKTVVAETMRVIFTSDEEPVHILWDDDYHYLIVPLVSL